MQHGMQMNKDHCNQMMLMLNSLGAADSQYDRRFIDAIVQQDSSQICRWAGNVGIVTSVRVY